MRHYKGWTVAGDARRRPARDLEIKLVVAGEYYDGQEKYEQLIDELGIRDHVIVRPYFIPSHEIGLWTFGRRGPERLTLSARDTIGNS